MEALGRTVLGWTTGTALWQDCGGLEALIPPWDGPQIPHLLWYALGVPRLSLRTHSRPLVHLIVRPALWAGRCRYQEHIRPPKQCSRIWLVACEMSTAPGPARGRGLLTGWVSGEVMELISEAPGAAARHAAAFAGSLSFRDAARERGEPGGGDYDKLIARRRCSLSPRCEEI